MRRANSDEPFSVATGPGPAMARHPDGLRAALDSLHSCVACSATDFGQYYRDSWLYGIIVGWDCEEDHEHDDICCDGAAMRELAARHGWDEATVECLRGYRRAVAAAMRDEPASA